MFADLKATKRPLVGYSTTVLNSPAELGEMIALQPDLVELCGIPHHHWKPATQALLDAGLPFGLHCPVPFDGYPAHFDITSSDPARQSYALDLLRATLDEAAMVGGRYVVAHFPSVFKRTSPSAAEDYRCADEAAARVVALQREYQLPILIENVGPNDAFGTGEDFARLFEAHPELRMCLDFGHVHSLHGGDAVYAFSRQVAPYVASIHFYNTSFRGDGAGFHYPPDAPTTPAEDWMDLPRLLHTVAQSDALDFIMFEYSAARGLPPDHYFRALDYLVEAQERCGR